MSAAVELGGRARGPARLATLSLPMAIGLVLTGLFAFAAVVLLSSYSDELSADAPTFATANDTSAVGYRALQVLLEELGHEVRVDPYPHRGAWNGRDLRLYFPTPAFSEERRERIDPAAPGLFVLPKWAAVARREDSREVILRSTPGLGLSALRIYDAFEPTHALLVQDSPRADFAVPGTDVTHTVRYPRWIVHQAEFDALFPEPDPEEEADAEQSDEGGEDAGDADEDADVQLPEQVEEIMRELRRADRQRLVDMNPPMDRQTVLHATSALNTLVLSDPDFLNNHGIAQQSGARAAVAVLSEAAAYFDIQDPVFVFDDSLRRRDVEQNVVKLLTRPPFLAATLCLLCAGALVGWQGFNRFGDARDAAAEDTASRGPRALAESAAGFIQGAGRLDALGPDYASVVRRQAVEALGLSVTDRRRADAALASREAVRGVSPTFDAIAANSGLSPMARARALLRWKQEITS